MMNVLLIEDQDLLRHAIMHGVDYLCCYSTITAYGSFDAFHDAKDGKRYDIALVDPGVPPIDAGNHNERLAALSRLIHSLPAHCEIIVLTGHFSESEAHVMLKAGAHKYLSKNGLNLFDLRLFIEDKTHRIFYPHQTGKQGEWFQSGLTEAEKIGAAIDQKMYDPDIVAASTGLDLDSLKKYVTRARKRMRS